jgi:hypothetical protein
MTVPPGQLVILLTAYIRRRWQPAPCSPGENSFEPLIAERSAQTHPRAAPDQLTGTPARDRMA